MTGFFKDYYRMGQALAALFLIGAAVSVYRVYAIPSDLSLAHGYQPAFISTYVSMALTFVLGGLAIYFMLQHRNELIVFRDKELEQKVTDRENANKAQSSISLDSITEELKQAQNENEILQAGLQGICKQLDAGQGAVYLITEEDGKRKLELKGGYALSIGESTVISYEVGEGLIGQAAASGNTLYVDDVPEGYIRIISGLGSASPRYLLITPVKKGDRVKGVFEIASFTPLGDYQRKFAEDAVQLIAGKIPTP